MLRSKTHETAVLLLGTGATDNNLADTARATGGGSGYDHVVMLQDLTRPDAKILRDLEKVRKRKGYWGGDHNPEPPADDAESESDDDGNGTSHELKMMERMVAKTTSSSAAPLKPPLPLLPPDPPPGTSISVPCDPLRGIIIAGDVLHRRTSKKRYNRTIYLITDGFSQITDGFSGELEHVLSGLKEMNVKMEVIGVGFKEEEGSSSQAKREDEGENEGENEGEEEAEDEEEEEESDDEVSQLKSGEKRFWRRYEPVVWSRLLLLAILRGALLSRAARFALLKTHSCEAHHAFTLRNR